MTYTTKYKIGDRIKYRIKKREEVESPCYFCGGSGEALDYQGHLEECPACEGSGYLWDEVPVEKELEKSLTTCSDSFIDWATFKERSTIVSIPVFISLV